MEDSGMQESTEAALERMMGQEYPEENHLPKGLCGPGTRLQADIKFAA